MEASTSSHNNENWRVTDEESESLSRPPGVHRLSAGTSGPMLALLTAELTAPSKAHTALMKSLLCARMLPEKPVTNGLNPTPARTERLGSHGATFQTTQTRCLQHQLLLLLRPPLLHMFRVIQDQVTVRRQKRGAYHSNVLLVKKMDAFLVQPFL